MKPNDETRLKDLLEHYAEADGRTINCTRDRKIQSLIHLVDGYIVLSALNAETLTKRFYQEW